ncbi:YtzI protein [Robertmurraya andreesenii]|uniref:Cell division septation protein DedD n=1 Tax=Anoxybacillus andreesenii TaxID=1325932 RepID=A0ABT9VA74_9BACL|nr:YtzI protein [Robertmurraya andreesenii]MDQ0157846.1 cell division septation protein DedD [Robertmurraya andreesenii]
MLVVLIICIIICFAVIILSAVVTSKAYSYKHSVDPLEKTPHLDNDRDLHT